ncbi:hypothetical protein ES703_47084 [subsurface metagenome]
MDPITLNKITRVQSQFMTKKTGKGDHTTGPYWFGYWQENGKTQRAYIGRQLPAELEVLLATRVKPPGHSLYHWPGRPQAAQKKALSK